MENEFIKRYKPLIINMANSISKEYTDDLINVGTNKLISLIKTYNKDKAKFWTYARKHIYGSMQDEMKLKLSWFGRRSNLQMIYIEELKGVDVLVDDNIEEILIRREKIEEIRKIKDSFPKEYRDVLKLIYWNGMTFKEAADVLGISQNRCFSLHKKALKDIKKQLGYKKW